MRKNWHSLFYRASKIMSQRRKALLFQSCAETRWLIWEYFSKNSCFNNHHIFVKDFQSFNSTAVDLTQITHHKWIFFSYWWRQKRHILHSNFILHESLKYISFAYNARCALKTEVIYLAVFVKYEEQENWVPLHHKTTQHIIS